MIDWYRLALNALQIAALALLLAMAGHAYWRAGAEGVRWREVVMQPGYLQAGLAALLVISAVQALLPDFGLLRLAWGAVAAWCVWELRRKAKPQNKPPDFPFG